MIKKHGTENCFSSNIDKARFRQLLGEVESSIDSLNKRKRLKSNMTLSMIILRLRERGLKKSLKRFYEILTSRG